MAVRIGTEGRNGGARTRKGYAGTCGGQGAVPVPVFDGHGLHRLAGLQCAGHERTGPFTGVGSCVDGPQTDARTPGARIPVAEVGVPLVVVEIEILQVCQSPLSHRREGIGGIVSCGVVPLVAPRFEAVDAERAQLKVSAADIVLPHVQMIEFVHRCGDRTGAYVAVSQLKPFHIA